ncbi:MAG: hypothetical protein EBR82_64395 [Caulobacteraceae bacterium]|nr:hypothetical protein [Caulobacteraceae bacterium]
MAVQLGMSVDGIKEVLQGFSKLSTGLQKQYLRGAVNKVTKPHIQPVKALIARGPTGNLKRSVGVVIEAKVKGKTQTAVLGFRRGDKAGENGKKSGYHAWWIENGVKTRTPENRRALKVPIAMAKKYKYLMGKVSLIGDDEGGSIFFRQVRGFAGTGKFASWADQTLPSIRDALQTELVSALAKAEAQAMRQAARKLK